MSCSSDGTIRLWNLDGKTTFNELRCDQCIRVKNIKGLRTSVTAARFDKKGKKVFCVEEVRPHASHGCVCLVPLHDIPPNPGRCSTCAEWISAMV